MSVSVKSLTELQDPSQIGQNTCESKNLIVIFYCITSMCHTQIKLPITVLYITPTADGSRSVIRTKVTGHRCWWWNHQIGSENVKSTFSCLPPLTTAFVWILFRKAGQMCLQLDNFSSRSHPPQWYNETKFSLHGSQITNCKCTCSFLHTSNMSSYPISSAATFFQ